MKWVNLVVKGEVETVEVGTETSSLVVAVDKTNHQARRFRGKHINVDIAPGTRLKIKDYNGDGKRDAADLAAGDRVIIKNRVPKGFAPPLEEFRMLPQQILVTRADAEAAPAPDGTE